MNRRALDRVGRGASGITSVINVLEVCGILSFNLSLRALHALYVHFAQRYRVAIVPGGGYGVRLPAPEARETLPIVAADLPSHQRCVERGSLLVVDALIVEVIEPDRLPSRRLERRYERRRVALLLSTPAWRDLGERVVGNGRDRCQSGQQLTA